MIQLHEKETGVFVGTITEAQLQFLMDQLEEESADDTDDYIDHAIVCHGVRRTRKLGRAQQMSITRSRTPAFHRRIRSLTIRQRLTLLLTCSIRSRRWCSTWFALCCASVRSSPRGFLVGMRISTWGSVKARKPRSCNNRLPAGKGYGVASAIGLSWTRPQ